MFEEDEIGEHSSSSSFFKLQYSGRGQANLNGCLILYAQWCIMKHISSVAQEIIISRKNTAIYEGQ